MAVESAVLSAVLESSVGSLMGKTLVSSVTAATDGDAAIVATASAGRSAEKPLMIPSSRPT